MGALYLHVPFCRHRCIYCDFYAVGSLRAPWGAYVDRLLSEARLRLPEVCEPLRTVYIGGGTPSQMPLTMLERLLIGLSSVYGSLFSPVEFTLEANPEDVTPEYVRAIRQLGVNRLSVGVQSLQNAELEIIGRRHTAQQALKCMDNARREIANISVDLMFGLPGQSMQSWKDTLSGILATEPAHLSAYSLMREPGTPLDIMLRQKRIVVAGDALNQQMYRHLTLFLREHGYRHYEISNYSRPGYVSQHNSGYWSGVPYIGLGAGAHSYDGDRVRRANLPDIKGYIASDKGQDVPHTVETLDDTQLREEYVMTRLRTAEGIDMQLCRSKLGEKQAAILARRCKDYAASEYGAALLHETDKGYALTEDGLMLSDSVILAVGF